MKCLYCEEEAVLGEYLFLDWWKRGAELDVYLVSACLYHKTHAMNDIQFFLHASRGGRNPLAFGAIVQVKSDNEAEIWSNIRLKESWRMAHRLRFKILNSDLPSFSRLNKADKYDWRGWTPGTSRMYHLHNLRAAEKGFELLVEVVRNDLKDEDWEPEVKNRIPPTPKL